MINWMVLNGKTTPETAPVRVTVRKQADLLEDLGQRLTQDTGFSVATLNLDHVVKLRHDPQFAAAYAAHSHVTADGNPIVWLLRMVGEQVTLLPGSELIEPVTALAARLGAPVGLVGSSDETLKTAGDTLQARYPGLNVAARIAPPMGFDPTGPDVDALARELQDSGARVIFLAFGAPKQEILAARLQQALPQAGFLSIGAGLDFIANTQTRAPVLARRLGAEWLWRLLNNPARLWRRYGACLLILPRLTLGALSLRLAQKR